jgi:large subunit ribosomal protein L21
MYAIFEDGSHQYRVEEGDVVQIDFRDTKVGASVEFDRILLAENSGETKIGQPTLAGARIFAEVIDMPKTKTFIQHFRRRKNYRRFRGHTQPYTAVRIQKIVL